MVDKEAIEWAKNQILAGYTIEEIRQYFLGYGYDQGNVEKIIEVVRNNESSWKNGANPEYVDPKTMNRVADEKNDNHDNREESEESSLMAGLYSGISSALVFFVIYFSLLFFDLMPSAQMNLSSLIFLLIAGTFIAIKSQGKPFKSVIFISLIACLIISIEYMGFLFYIKGSIVKFSMTLQEMDEYGRPISLNMVILISAILLSITITVATLIIKAILGRMTRIRPNFIKPMIAITSVYIIGLAIFSMTGGTVSAEPIDPYWCDDTSYELCSWEDIVENGAEEGGYLVLGSSYGIKDITGYTYDSYFSATPTKNNKLEMKDYEIHTLAMTLANFGLIYTDFGFAYNNIQNENKTDLFYDEVIRKTGFKKEKIDASDGDEAIISAIEAYTEYLSNLKPFIEKYSDGWYTNQKFIKNKEEHIRFIETKIKIFNALKERIEQMEISENSEGPGLYSNLKRDIIREIVDTYNDLIDEATI